MSAATRFVFSVAAVGILGLGAWMAPGCQPAETAGPPYVDAGIGVREAGISGIAYCGTKGDICCGQPTPANHAPVPALRAGVFPNPTCDDGDETQCATSTTCSVQEPLCGSIAPGSCEPLTQNTGTTQNFRMRRLIIAAPASLANATVQQGVINSGVDMNEPACGEIQTGDFSWLLSFDTVANTLKTGGAPPCDFSDAGASCDPFNTGYCFVNKLVTSQSGSIQVQPVTVATIDGGDGTLQTAAIPSLNIPIYFQGSIITLPIHGGSLAGVAISDNGNCIGSVNVNAMDPSCADNYEGCSKWLTAGALAGYITLNEANKVEVLTLSSTLCVLLTTDRGGAKIPLPGGGTLSSCTTDANGNVTDKGDYCSKLPDGGAGPGGCADSFWLAATFAASAVKINDGTGVADCTGGGSPVDSGAVDSGGTDAGEAGPGDSGHD